MPRKLLVFIAAFALAVAGLGAAQSATASPPPHAPASPGFGPNVIVFDPSMPRARSRRPSTRSYAQQVDDEMGNGALRAAVQAGRRTAPPTDPLIFQVGYYTEVAGLGPVTRRRHHQRSRRRLQPLSRSADNCIALDNFWRSLSEPDHQRRSAARTAAGPRPTSGRCRRPHPMRRVDVTGANLSLHGLLHGRPAVRERRLHRRLQRRPSSTDRSSSG